MLLALLWIAATLDSPGHDLFTAFVQHRLHLQVGARNLDLTLDLTFFEEWSGRERQKMDSDGDGRITRSEIDIYLKRLASSGLSQQVRLTHAGKPVPLALLYEPEIDLLGSNRAAPAHHQLRLSFFAPTPPSLQAGDELRVESGLWADAKALVSVQVDGQDGCQMQGDAGREPLVPQTKRASPIHFATFKCLRPPFQNLTTNSSR